MYMYKIDRNVKPTLIETFRVIKYLDTAGKHVYFITVCPHCGLPFMIKSVNSYNYRCTKCQELVSYREAEYIERDEFLDGFKNRPIQLSYGVLTAIFYNVNSKKFKPKSEKDFEEGNYEITYEDIPEFERTNIFNNYV